MCPTEMRIVDIAHAIAIFYWTACFGHTLGSLARHVVDLRCGCYSRDLALVENLLNCVVGGQ